MVGPALLDDLGDDSVHAVQAGWDAPVDGGEGKRGAEGRRGGSGVGVWDGCCKRVGSGGLRGLVGGGFLVDLARLLQDMAGEDAVAVGLLVKVTHELAPSK